MFSSASLSQPICSATSHRKTASKFLTRLATCNVQLPVGLPCISYNAPLVSNQATHATECCVTYHTSCLLVGWFADDLVDRSKRAGSSPRIVRGHGAWPILHVAAITAEAGWNPHRHYLAWLCKLVRVCGYLDVTSLVPAADCVQPRYSVSVQNTTDHRMGYMLHRTAGPTHGRLMASVHTLTRAVLALLLPAFVSQMRPSCEWQTGEGNSVVYRAYEWPHCLPHGSLTFLPRFPKAQLAHPSGLQDYPPCLSA